MKKRLTIIAVLMMLCSTMFGQTHWNLETNYQNSMSVICSVNMNGNTITEGVEVAAFCEGVLRSDGALIQSDGLVYLNVWGNKNDKITFKLYDGEDEWVSTGAPLTFRIDAIYGYPNPIQLNFVKLHWDYIGNPGVTMSVTCSIMIDDEPINSTNYQVAAFSGDELRGVTFPEKITLNGETIYLSLLTVAGILEEIHDEYGTYFEPVEETISFKLWDYANNKEYVAFETIPFTQDGNIGYPEPYELNFLTFEPVAKIGDDNYSTLAEAVEAATEGNNVITLLKDVEGSGVEINKEVTIDFAGFAYTLNESEVINIQEDGVVTFLNDAEITSGVELNGGQLFTENTNLTVNAVKHFTKVDSGNTNGWGTISTPIAGAEIPEIAGAHDLYSYDEESMMWVYGGSLEKFELGQGYLYANTHQDNDEDIAIELQGVLNTKNVTVQLNYHEANSLAGFNMIGNPFSFNISEANFSGATLSNGFYVISAEGAIVARPENAVIAPMESVMVQTNAAATLTINKNAASKRNATDNGMIAINVANGNYSDVAYVSFNEGIGLNKISHHNADVPMVYIPVEGENFAVAMMNQDVTEVPVSFKAATMGEYTISVEAQDCEYGMMILKDRLTGNVTNLLIEDYTFVATSNDNADRFVIELSNSQQSTYNSNFAYINNGMINIDNIEGQAVVRIYDVTGRSVAEYNAFETASISTSSLSNGIYIIKMTDNKGVKIQKILID